MLNSRLPRFYRGFTLIEIATALAIVAILAAIALQYYSGYVDRARVASFLVQLDGWRNKAAIEAQAFSADLCNWDDAQFGSLRERIFDTTSSDPLLFSDYRLDVTSRGVKPSKPGELRPFVVDVVATLSEGQDALRVARLIRQKVEELGLRYISPSTDKDRVTIQAFSVQLANCAGRTVGGGQGAVGGVVSIGPKPPTQVPPTGTPAKPQPPNCRPGEVLTPDNSACQPKTCPPGQQLDAGGNCYTPAHCSPVEIQSADGKSCQPKTCPAGQQLDNSGNCFTPAQCGVGQVQSADQKSCVPKTCSTGQHLDTYGQCVNNSPCPGRQHLNPHGKCVGPI